MLYFYSTDQEPTNAAHYRGKLFEELLRDYLKAGGYAVELRSKRSSLEYDLLGRHTVDNRVVVGEAKAHANTIGGSDVAAFIGKALPFFYQEKQCSALFLSVSPLSPEASDFLANLASTTPHQIAEKCGAELEQHVRELLRLPTTEQARLTTQHLIPLESSQHVLHTNRGTFVAVIGCAQEAAFDDRFALLTRAGALVTDNDLLNLVKENVQAFQELEPLAMEEVQAGQFERIPRRDISFGLVTAVDWLDYRRPAGKTFFVGRQDALDKAEALALRHGGGAIIEIKARSGVGKSSLLSVLATTWEEAGYRVELHDVRDVQSSEDVLRLIQRFVGPAYSVRNFEDVAPALDCLTDALHGRHAIFLVDQFESTFQTPEVFAAYEYFALCVARSKRPCSMVYSRKDDLLTTHDDIVVSLDRLRGLAQSITLDDFSIAEATSLIQRIAETSSGKLSSKIYEQVLEFAQGFPWLLKRTMTHVVSMVGKGASQQELLSSGLHLEDLFEEELSELDELERGYLTRIAAALPATYHTLARRFEDDPFLRKMLEKLTYRKLLRLSAGTYDTYNDVFKDFLLYERMPERSYSHIIRMGVIPVMKSFRALGGATNVDPTEMSGRLGKSISGTYNILRDLRLSGLVIRSPNGWEVPDVVRQYEHQGRLGEYVRQSLLRNRTVSDFLIHIEKSGGMPRREIPAWLQGHFPFMLAKDEVWLQYTRMLLDWLSRLRLAEIENDEIVRPCRDDKESVFKQLGNLNFVGRGNRPKSMAFVPSVPWTTLKRVWGWVSDGEAGEITLSRAERTALLDLKRLGAVSSDETLHQAPLWRRDELESKVIEMLAKQPYLEFWSLLRQGTPYEAALERSFGFGDLAESTRSWLAKKLSNWGRTFGFLPAGRLNADRTDSGDLDFGD